MPSLKEAAPQALFDTMRGHGSPKKSKLILVPDSKPDPIHWLTIRRLKQAMRLAAANKRRRSLALARGKKLEYKARTILSPPACYKRVREFFGEPTKGMLFSSQPAAIQPRPSRFIYELHLGMLPFCTFTDWKEAEASLEALHAFGFPGSYIYQRDLRSQEQGREIV